MTTAQLRLLINLGRAVADLAGKVRVEQSGLGAMQLLALSNEICTLTSAVANEATEAADDPHP